MAVVIKKVIDGKLKDIKNGKYNIFISISLGNPYFTRERVKEFVQWAIKHTRENVVIFIADKIQAINYEVLRGMSEQESIDAAKKRGDDSIRMAERVIRSLPPEQQGLVSVTRWKDIKTSELIDMQRALKEEYELNIKFKTEIHRTAKEVLGEKIPEGVEALNRLGDYVLEEMPLMFKGITVNNNHYDVFLYPGLSELDVLVSDIQSRKRFSEIADKLELTSKQPIIEAYIK